MSDSHSLSSDTLRPCELACQLPSVHGILQARILEWVVYLLQGIFSTQNSNSGLLQADRFFTIWATREYLNTKNHNEIIIIIAIKNQYHTIIIQFSSVAQSCPTLCEPMNRSTPGFPVHHHLPEFTQTQVHWVGDAIQPSHPLSSPFPPAPNPSQHQSLFQWVSPSHEVAKVLEFQLNIIPSKEYQGWSPSEWTGWISLQSKRLSRVFSNTTVQKHQFFSAQLSSQSNFNIHTWPLEKP